MICTLSKCIDSSKKGTARRRGSIASADGHLLETRKQALYRRAKSFDGVSGDHQGRSSTPVPRRRCRRNKLSTKKAKKNVDTESLVDRQNSRWESQPHNHEKADGAPKCTCGRDLSLPAPPLRSPEPVDSDLNHDNSTSRITTDEERPPLQQIEVVVMRSRWDNSDSFVAQNKKLRQTKPERILSPKSKTSSLRRTMPTSHMPRMPSRKQSSKEVRARAG